MEIKYSKDSLKYLARLDKKTVENLRAAIANAAKTPPVGDIKPLKGYNDGRMRIRLGKYRIIYKITSDGAVEVLLVIEIGPRGDIYK